MCSEHNIPTFWQRGTLEYWLCTFVVVGLTGTRGPLPVSHILLVWGSIRIQSTVLCHHEVKIRQTILSQGPSRHLNNIRSLILQSGMSFCLFRSFVISFKTLFLSKICFQCISFATVKFISKYFIFQALINGRVFCFFFSFSDCLLQVFKHTVMFVYKVMSSVIRSSLLLSNLDSFYFTFLSGC